MKASWTIETLDSVAEMATDKISVNKLTAESYVSTENMLPDRGGVELAPKIPPSGNVNAFCPGDVLLSNIRTYFKKVWLAPRHGGASADVIIFRPRGTQRIDSKFLFYVLSSDAFIESTVTASKGTKMPRGDKDAMRRYELSLPALPIQQRIAGILSAYDELIENSQRRIKILESMARALYREWFVHFRFPGHESVARVPSPLGDIPQGWEVKPFTEIADVLSGGTPKTDVTEYWDGEIPFFTPRDVPNCFYVQDTDKHVTALGLSKCASEFYPPDTVFITARGTVGKVALPSVPMAMNQSCYALRGKPGFPQRFVFLMTLQQVDYLKTNTGGATFDTIVVDTFRRMEVVKPASDIVATFTKKTDAIFEQVNTLQRQIQNLRSTRDLLLPRLLSGQIDVSNLPELTSV